MLSKAGFPLSNTQISNFFLEQEYTDYFRVQEVIGDLVDANLIHAESTHSNTQYSPYTRENISLIKNLKRSVFIWKEEHVLRKLKNFVTYIH